MAEDAKEKHHSGSGFFKGLTQVFKLAAGFAIGGYVGSILFDPLFFPVIHDMSNAMAQTVINFTAANFGWVHDVVGLTGDGGFLNWEPVKSFLSPYAPVSSTASAAFVGAAGGSALPATSSLPFPSPAESAGGIIDPFADTMGAFGVSGP